MQLIQKIKEWTPFQAQWNRRIVGVLTMAMSVAWVSGCTPSAHRYKFNPGTFQTHVNYLASDELEGRGLGTEGIEKAADYIAEQFRICGLEPAGENGTYFQTFNVKLKPVLTDDGFLEVQGADVPVKRGEDYVPFPFSSSGEFEGDVVFAGYGITHEDKGYDDYVHLDVAGKAVLMLRREPPGWATEEGVPTPHAGFPNKVYTAKEHQAAVVLIVNQKPEADEEDHLTSWQKVSGGASSADFGVPALHVTRRLADELLAAGGLESLDRLQEKLDNGGYASAVLQGVSLKGNPGITREEQPTRNVMGMLPGEGSLAHEVLVIGAHYDHLGIAVPRTTFARKKKATTEAEPAIHNGADDNASGTSGVIELARMLRQSGPLKRSVLFMAFTGEESGLLGSKYFVDHPTVPLDRMVTMLNMDMIGRLPENSNTIQVFGTKAAEEFESMFNRLAPHYGLEVRGSGSAHGPSDHTAFYTKKIPAVHFFTGLHVDYHLPGDDVEKINAKGAATVLGYICSVACEIINADKRPTYHRVAPPAAQAGQSKFRVRMGLMPSYADSEDGMGIDGVLEDSPAEEAGMKDGDVIVRIGQSRIKNVYDYMGALRNMKPGDEVEVVVLRDGKEVTLTVKLAGG